MELNAIKDTAKNFASALLNDTKKQRKNGTKRDVLADDSEEEEKYFRDK